MEDNAVAQSDVLTLLVVKIHMVAICTLPTSNAIGYPNGTRRIIRIGAPDNSPHLLKLSFNRLRQIYAHQL